MTTTDSPWGVFTEEDFQLFDRVSRSLRKRAHGLLDYEDLYQSAALWALENRKKFESRADNPRYQFSMVKYHLADVIRREKAKREGYEVEDEQFYSVKVLRKLIPLCFDPAWMEQSQQYESDPTSKGGEPSDPANAWVMVADVKRVFPKLKDEDRVLLYRTLAGPGEYAQVTRDIAIEDGTTPKHVQDEVRHALSRLSKLLRRD